MAPAKTALLNVMESGGILAPPASADPMQFNLEALGSATSALGAASPATGSGVAALAALGAVAGGVTGVGAATANSVGGTAVGSTGVGPLAAVSVGGLGALPLPPSPTASLDGDKTKLTVDYGYRVFREYAQSKAINEVDNLPVEDIATLLQTFYDEARTRDGVPFSANSLVVIRYAINRYYRSPLVNRQIDIVRDPAFHEANRTFKNIVRRLHQEEKLRGPGAAPQRVRSNVLSEDQVKLREYFVAHLATPRGLLHKVWFDLSGHMDPRLVDKIQELTRETFKVVRHWNPENNCSLASIFQLMDNGEPSTAILTERPGDPLCPVLSYETYLARLNPNCQSLFQRPKDIVSPGEAIWFHNSPLGKTLLSKMMSSISKCAQLSRVYGKSRTWAAAGFGLNKPEQASTGSRRSHKNNSSSHNNHHNNNNNNNSTNNNNNNNINNNNNNNSNNKNNNSHHPHHHGGINNNDTFSVDMLLQAEALQASFNPKAHAGLLNVSAMGMPGCQQAPTLASLLPVWHQQQRQQQQQQQQHSGSTSPAPSAQQRSNGDIADDNGGMVNAWIREALLNPLLYQGKIFPGLLRRTEDPRRGSDSLRSPEVAEMLGFEALSMLGLPIRPPGPSRSHQASGPGLDAQQSPVALLKKGSHSDGQSGRRPRNLPPASGDLHAVLACSPRERSHPARDSRDSRSGSRSPSPSPGRSHSASPDNNNLVITQTPPQRRSPQVPTSNNPGSVPSSPHQPSRSPSPSSLSVPPTCASPGGAQARACSQCLAKCGTSLYTLSGPHCTQEHTFCSAMCLGQWASGQAQASLFGSSGSSSADQDSNQVREGLVSRSNSASPNNARSCDYCRMNSVPKNSPHHMVAADNSLKSFCSIECLQLFDLAPSGSTRRRASDEVADREASSPGGHAASVTRNILRHSAASPGPDEEERPLKMARKNPAPQRIVRGEELVLEVAPFDLSGSDGETDASMSPLDFSTKP